jgi:hypothetical protein
MKWHIDRLASAGPACALATLALPLALAGLVSSFADNDRVLGLLIVASLVIFLGSLIGSTATATIGVAIFGIGAMVAEVPVAVLVGVGAGLFATLAVHDLAGIFRRAPRISTRVWTDTAATVVAVVGASALLFAITSVVSSQVTLQAIAVPFGLAAIGFAAKVAADSHRSVSRGSRRTPAP